MHLAPSRLFFISQGQTVFVCSAPHTLSLLLSKDSSLRAHLNTSAYFNGSSCLCLYASCTDFIADFGIFVHPACNVAGFPSHEFKFCIAVPVVACFFAREVETVNRCVYRTAAVIGIVNKGYTFLGIAAGIIRTVHLSCVLYVVVVVLEMRYWPW
mmetsp:Transcript_107654/g.161043  ORF Transcript_107654/g.161043 Transcript_107654/m.161043 type:complete len:155 (+) Transcript_107654:745-1209(+)